MATVMGAASAAMTVVLMGWFLSKGGGLAGLREWIERIAADGNLVDRAIRAASDLCTTAASKDATHESKEKHFIAWRRIVYECFQAEHTRRKRKKDLVPTLVAIIATIVAGALGYLVHMFLTSEADPPKPWTQHEAKIFALFVSAWSLCLGALFLFGMKYAFMFLKHGAPSRKSGP